MRPGRRQPGSRRGSVYVMVMAAGVVLTALGIAGLSLVRVQRERDELRRGADRARVAARAGLDAAAGVLWADPAGATWRSGASRTVVDTDLGGVWLLVTATDPADGNLAGAERDPVRLVSEASCGAARQTYACVLDPVMENLPILSCAAWTRGNVTLTGKVLSDGVVGSSTGIAASGASVYAPVTAPTITGSTYYKLTRPGAAAETVPGSAAVAAWAAKGTPISYASIAGQLRRCVLGAGVNPYGAVNASGVYVIDCRGNALDISDCRVRGTLVVLNAGSGTRLRNAVFIEGVAGQPALLIDGPVDFEQDSADLTESNAGVNLNPPGAPYLGQTDADKSDAYPSVLEGVVLVTGNVTVRTAATVEGVLLVGGTLAVDGTLVLRRSSPESPVEGFDRAVGLALDASSVQPVVR